ncbi:hypothetical protein F4810DRAFT_380461 [Camillea tinctor]|nr:hypothetical protein F4810DRAFT_380461 [Camillea tinctor]
MRLVFIQFFCFEFAVGQELVAARCLGNKSSDDLALSEDETCHLGMDTGRITCTAPHCRPRQVQTKRYNPRASGTGAFRGLTPGQHATGRGFLTSSLLPRSCREESWE